LGWASRLLRAEHRVMMSQLAASPEEMATQTLISTAH
jgi:hypothetical protein